jgi:hypothetical protein
MGKKPRSLRRPNGGRFSKSGKKCGFSPMPDALLVTAAVPEPVLRPCPLPPTPRLLVADTLLAIAKGEMRSSAFGFDHWRSRHDTAQMLVGRDMIREAMTTHSDRNAVSIASSSLRDLGIEAGSSRLSVYMPASAARMRALCELARGFAVAPGCEIVFSEAWR